MKHWAKVLLFKEKINYKTTKNTNLTRIFFYHSSRHYTNKAQFNLKVIS